MLRAENLVKRFEDKTALDGLNTEIRRGCIYGLVGPNGSGKSTLMRLMCGVYRPDGGRVTLEGEDIFENIAAKDRILYLSDDLYFPPKSTVEDLASFYRGLYSGFSMETYHTLCGCFPLQTDQPLSTFSKGMRRQAALLAALCCHADYLLLDEAFDGLDPVIRLMVKKLLAEEIAERGTTVMISSHNLRELEDLCDQVGLLSAGRLLFEKDLDVLKLGFCRVQAAYDHPVDWAATGLAILDKKERGKLVSLLVRGTAEDTLAVLEARRPLFAEALPMTANTLLTAALAGIRHGMTPDRAAFHLGGVALDLLGWYVTAFAIIVMVYLAATQVGSTFDTFLFSGVFLAALPVLCLTHTVMCQSYLAGWNYDMKWQIFCVLTPVLTMIGSYTTYGEWLYAAMAIWLAAGVLLLWAAVRLYTRRPSERAESRCREGLAAGVFRFIATFVGGLGFGTLFGMISGADSRGTMLLWIAVFALAVYFFVELILGRGFKGMKRGSIMMGAAMAAVTVLYAGILFTGGLGFEKRVPAAERLASVTLDYRGRYNNVYLNEAERLHSYEGENHAIYYSYDSIGEVTLRGPEALKAATALHRLLTESDQNGVSGENHMGRIELEYTFNDGRVMKRVYHAYGGDALLAAYAALEDTPEFQSRTNPLYYWVAEESPYREIDLCDATGFHKTALTETDYDTAALVAALRLDMLAEKAMDYYDQERRTVCYLYLESELDEKYSHQPAEKDFYSSFTVPVGESYTHTLELLREWGLEGYLIPAEWDSMFVTAWGCDVVGTGRVILPLWYGVETEIFSQAAYEAGILLSREEAEPLLALADWTYPNTGSDDCLYLSLVRTAADGTKTYGLPMFLPLEEARRQPLLREYMAEQYGEKLSTPETVDAETLEAR